MYAKAVQVKPERLMEERIRAGREQMGFKCGVKG